jgi:prepilin-type N-terminal cleavage/methylation domain-containing protein
MKFVSRRAFTIIELLIVVIVVGLLAAAGVAKYQHFVESGTRKTCLVQLQTIEKAMSVWEGTNQVFGENAKFVLGFTPRSGRLTNYARATTTILGVGTAVAALSDRNQRTVGGPAKFVNAATTGPLGSVIRDDKVWICPGALSRYYRGEIQRVPDNYLDTIGGGVTPAHGGTPIGMGGRYFAAVAGRGNSGTGIRAINNTGFPRGWLNGIGNNGLLPTSVNPLASPCPQVPFKMVLCGCYGTFGPNGAWNTSPGTSAYNNGGAVGPNRSKLTRHSARW